jgi:hypothetical protein
MQNLKHKGITLIGIIFFLAGCSSSSNQTIPDAPPPYPSFPIPQERYQSAQVYGGQPSTSTYVPPFSDTSSSYQSPTPSPKSVYAPPPSSPPTQNSFTKRPFQTQTNSKGFRGQKANTERFTLEAKADLWALVQDSQGTELEWLKMKTGETASLSYSGSLTITCSSGNKLVIKNKFGKKIETNPNSSGISIVRLPSK